MTAQQTELRNNEVKTWEDIQSYCIQCVDASESGTDRQEQLDRAGLNSDFYRGAQWTEEEYNAYINAGVFPMTVNRCRAQIKSMMGLYTNNKQEVRIIPRKGGTEVAANIYTELFRHTSDMSNGDFVFFEAFRKGAIEIESWLHFQKNKTRNVGGQIEFSVCSTFDTFVDPGCGQYDINEPGKEARFFINRTFKTIEELELTYPEYADQFQVTSDYIGNLADSLMGIRGRSTAEERYCRLPLRQVWWRQARKAAVLGDKKTRKVVIVTEAGQIAKAKHRAARSNRFEFYPFVNYVLHCSTLVNETLVEDETDPFGDGFNKLPFARFSPFYDNGYASGMIDDIKDLNKEENINRTQATRYLNQTINSGWIVDDGNDTNAVRQLQQYGSVNGVIIDKSKLGGGVEKIKPNPLSQGHIYNADRAGQDIKEVTGLNDEVMGYDKGKVESGRAIALRQRQGIQSNEPVFQNFYWTLQLFGQMVFDAIRTSEVYTEEEIRGIVKESALLTEEHIQKAERQLIDKMGGGLPAPQQMTPPDPGLLSMIPLEQKGQVFEQIESGMRGAKLYNLKYPMLRETFDKVVKEFAVNELLQELKTSELAEYGVKVITSPAAQSVRMANFAELDAIQEKYGTIPADIFVEATDLSNKEQIISRMRQAEQAQQQMAQAQIQAAQQPQVQGAVA